MINLKDSILKDINLKDGNVTYYDFEIDFNLPFEDQKWSFKEDLIQILYGEGKYIIDVGWYPEFEPSGYFAIVAIKDYEWDAPIFEKKCKDIKQLKQYILEAIEIIDKDKNQ